MSILTRLDDPQGVGGYIYIYICIYTCIYKYMYTYIYIYVCMYLHMFLFTDKWYSKLLVVIAVGYTPFLREY